MLDFPNKKEKKMPSRTEKTFKTHFEVELGNSDKIGKSMNEIRRIFDTYDDSVVSVSGGKDSLVLLHLAERISEEHRVFHYDWGSSLIPRKIEMSIVDNIRRYVLDRNFYVASRGNKDVETYSRKFKKDIQRGDGIKSKDGSLDKLGSMLDETDKIGLQMLGLREEESGSRERKIDSELFGWSLSQKVAYPIRNWSARDVWSYIVYNDIEYPNHYDRVSDGSPRSYENSRLSTYFDPEFEKLSHSVGGLGNWRFRGVNE